MYDRKIEIFQFCLQVDFFTHRERWLIGELLLAYQMGDPAGWGARNLGLANEVEKLIPRMKEACGVS